MLRLLSTDYKRVVTEKTLLIEIITYAPTAYYHCTHCEVVWREMGATHQLHDEQVKNSLPPDLILEYLATSDWVRGLFRQYRYQVIIKVIDATSIEGFFKSLRYGMHNYPAVIVDCRRRFVEYTLQ